MQGETLSLEQVAQYCGVDPAAVHDWISQGKLQLCSAPRLNAPGISVLDLMAMLYRQSKPLPDQLAQYARHVLIADDDLLISKAIALVLRQAGFTVETAKDGFQAASILASFAPVVLVLDLNMPEMEGMEVLDYIRRDSRFAHVGVVVVSGAGSDQLKAALARGANRVMRKPFNKAELISAVAELAQNWVQHK